MIKIYGFLQSDKCDEEIANVAADSNFLWRKVPMDRLVNVWCRDFINNVKTSLSNRITIMVSLWLSQNLSIGQSGKSFKAEPEDFLVCHLPGRSVGPTGHGRCELPCWLFMWGGHGLGQGNIQCISGNYCVWLPGFVFINNPVDIFSVDSIDSFKNVAFYGLAMITSKARIRWDNSVQW